MSNYRQPESNGETRENSISWAEKARRSTPIIQSVGINKENDIIPPLCLEGNNNEEEQNKELQRESDSILLQKLPADMWEIISSYLNFLEVQLLSSTCRFLWLLIHRRDNIWRSQLEYFRYDMKEMRGDGQLLCTEFITPTSYSAYERIKLERKIYSIDARREWHFRDREKTDKSEGIFSCPLTLSENDETNNNGWGEEEFTPLSQIRVFKPILLEFSRNSTIINNGSFPIMNNSNTSGSIGNFNNSFGINGNGESTVIRTPSEYLTLCDNINHWDFTGSRHGIQDCNNEEDEMFIFALLQTLSRAKHRPPPRVSTNETRTSRHLILRYFGGMLLTICRYEAERIFETLLRMPGLLDDFVLFSDPKHLNLQNTNTPLTSNHTRYFIAPELCRRGRVGIIVADPIRVLVVVAKERITRDDPRWDEAHTTAVEEGRAVFGTGMNPQQLRRG